MKIGKPSSLHQSFDGFLRTGIVLLLALLAAFAWTSEAAAQTVITASISGYVTDEDAAGGCPTVR